MVHQKLAMPPFGLAQSLVVQRTKPQAPSLSFVTPTSHRCYVSSHGGIVLPHTAGQFQGKALDADGLTLPSLARHNEQQTALPRFSLQLISMYQTLASGSPNDDRGAVEARQTGSYRRTRRSWCS